VSAFSQTISADSLYLAEAKDSILADGFIKKITKTSIYDVTEKLKNGSVTHKANDTKIITVEVYKDSIYFQYIPLTMSLITFHKGSFIKKSGHWYYYCSRSDRAWVLNGIYLMEEELKDFD
jgi:hypothetical protein